MAKFIAWRSFYSVGHDGLDAQHQQILGIINELYKAMEDQSDQGVVEPLLNRLQEYTRKHFAYEESIMEECGFPGIEYHRELHNSLRQRTDSLKAHVGLVLKADLLMFLKDWWLGHIQDEDQHYRPYLSNVLRPTESHSANW